MKRIRVGFFSFVEVTDPAEHKAYNEWHQLDHLPEQDQIEGVAYGQRFVGSPRCRDARLVSEPEMGPGHYVALYLMGGAIWYAMGSESSWFEIDATHRAFKLAWVIAAGATSYFVALFAMGMRLRDFTRQS